MSDGGNDTWRVWRDLRRKEEEVDGGVRGFARAGIGWGLDQLGRVERVRKALDDSGPIAQRMIAQRLAGIDLSAIWPILLAACQDIALYYGGSVVVGGVIGGIRRCNRAGIVPCRMTNRDRRRNLGANLRRIMERSGLLVCRRRKCRALRPRSYLKRTLMNSIGNFWGNREVSTT
jgi:hypothetical protein